MNLTKLFETQKALDERIVKEKGREGQDLFPEKILALLTELGELSNEWRGFKFWSEDREPRTERKVGCHVCRGEGYFMMSVDNDDEENCEYCAGTGLQEDSNPLLEEYVDCLHFILSIGLESRFEHLDFEAARNEYLSHRIDFKEVSITRQFNNVFHFIVKFEEESLSDEFVSVVLSFIVLGEALGFTWNQIETAYYEKNAINHSRQESNY